MHSVAEINAQLKAQNAGVAVRNSSKRLALRATLPPKPGSHRTCPYQQDVSTGIRDNQPGRVEIHRRALKMSMDLATGRFDWAEWLRPRVARQEMLITVIDRFAIDYRQKAERDGRSRWQITWRKDYLEPFEKLTATRPLDTTEMKRIIDQYGATTKPRQRHARAYTALCRYVGLNVEFDAGTYGHKQAKPIAVPTDDEILLGYDKAPERYRWAYGVMAAYGLRPSEVEEVVGFDGYELILGDGKTGARRVLPWPSEWFDRWDLSRAFYPIPKGVATNGSMERRLVAMAKVFSRDVGFAPKTLRKAMALRLMLGGVPDTIASQVLGHDPATLREYYQSYLGANRVRSAWEQWNQRPATSKNQGIKDRKPRDRSNHGADGSIRGVASDLVSFVSASKQQLIKD